MSTVEGLTVELIYPYSGERITFPVDAIWPTLVAIRWGMSGHYDLNLKSNTLTARSASAQRKGRCLWIAADIEAVREMVRAHFGRGREEGRAALERHQASMPRPSVADGAERIGMVLEREGWPMTGNDNGGRR